MVSALDVELRAVLEVDAGDHAVLDKQRAATQAHAHARNVDLEPSLRVSSAEP